MLTEYDMIYEQEIKQNVKQCLVLYGLIYHL